MKVSKLKDVCFHRKLLESSIKFLALYWQTGTKWPGGRKVGREQKSGRPPTYINIFIPKINCQTIKEQKQQHQKTKDLQTH